MKLFKKKNKKTSPCDDCIHALFLTDNVLWCGVKKDSTYKRGVACDHQEEREKKHKWRVF